MWQPNDAEDFKISNHAMGITLRRRVDEQRHPVLYGGEPCDKGYLVTRDGTRVLRDNHRKNPRLRLRRIV